eukprot:scaffold40748_cov22-Tisochrysis_lutea.AAC.1
MHQAGTASHQEASCDSTRGNFLPGAAPFRSNQQNGARVNICNGAVMHMLHISASSVTPAPEQGQGRTRCTAVLRCLATTQGGYLAGQPAFGRASRIRKLLRAAQSAIKRGGPKQAHRVRG